MAENPIADVADTLNSRRDRAAETIEHAADGLHRVADRVADRVPAGASRVAHTTADKLGAAASYVRDHSARDVLADIESFVKSHPAQALAVAAVAGFLAGRAIRRS